MIDGHWLSLSHLCYNCMKYVSGLSTSYSDALTIIPPNVFPWKRLNYFQRSCASPLQSRKKSASINYSIDTDGDLNGRTGGCTFFFPDTSCLMAGLAEARGVPPWSRGSTTGGSSQRRKWDRPPIHVGALGVWQQWLRQREFICLLWRLSTASPTSSWLEQAVQGFWVERPPAKADTTLHPIVAALSTGCTMFYGLTSVSPSLKWGHFK